jgi:hypothetical protein
MLLAQNPASSSITTKKDDPEKEGIGLQQVAGPDVLGVVAQKRRPGLLGKQRPAYLLRVLLDGALGLCDAQLEQLTSNPPCSPNVAILRHVLAAPINLTNRGVPFDTSSKAWYDCTSVPKYLNTKVVEQHRYPHNISRSMPG